MGTTKPERISTFGRVRTHCHNAVPRVSLAGWGCPVGLELLANVAHVCVEVGC
jgi:hypothetical protein